MGTIVPPGLGECAHVEHRLLPQIDLFRPRKEGQLTFQISLNWNGLILASWYKILWQILVVFANRPTTKTAAMYQGHHWALVQPLKCAAMTLTLMHRVPR